MKNTHPVHGSTSALAFALGVILASPAALAQGAPTTPASTPAPAPRPLATAAPTSPPIPTAPSGAPAPAPRAGYDTGRIPAYVVGGLAIVSLGVGTVFAALSLSDHQQFTKNPTGATANAGEVHEVTADMCFGGAATLAVAAVVMFLTHETPPPESVPPAPRVTWSPVVGPRGAGAGASITF